MQSTSKWVKNYQSVVDNGRNHAIVIDLPKGQNGDDLAPTALELAVMGLSGCISTIFAMVAAKMRLEFTQLEVELKAEKGDQTISEAGFVLKIESDASDEKIRKCLDATLNTCPVGVLFSKAGVEVKSSIIRL